MKTRHLVRIGALLVALAAILLPVHRAAADPARQTIWEFLNTYSGPGKSTLLQQRIAVGQLVSGNGEWCSGTMVSPHIFMTAAHCSGPGWTGIVRFFRLNEHAATPTQDMSEAYPAQTFPWQSFTSATGGGDTELWLLENGSDGVAPGIKYGYLDLSPGTASVGDRAYSFWVNPGSYAGVNLPVTLLYSEGAVTSRYDGGWRGPSTDLSIFAAPGASGSPVLRFGDYQVMGVTSAAPTGGGTPRTVADTRHLLDLYDADHNNVLDAIEYDLFFTRSPQDFYLLQFDTATQRAQWVTVPAAGANAHIATPYSEIDGTAPGATDGLWDRTARFVPNATYRISLAALGTAAGQTSYLKFRSDSSGDEVTMPIAPKTGWARFTGRVTLHNYPDYRLIVGTNHGGNLFVQNIALTRESSADVSFDTGDERRAWEYWGASYPSTSGIDGSQSFSGLVGGSCSSWCLRNRYIGLRAHHTYDLTFRAKHVSGSLFLRRPYVRIMDLGGNVLFQGTWGFSAVGQQLTVHERFTTGDVQGETLCFGAGAPLSYMVDHIHLQEVG